MEAVNSNASGKIEISDLRWTNRSEVSRIKETRAEKSYTIRFSVEDRLKSPSSLNQSLIYRGSLWNNKHRREYLTGERTKNASVRLCQSTM
ncbi:MAG: hypothetical protein Ct9H90mP14_0810 [Methanobacteriota archaeon]|nr:MAG: hypothetical protein Ct9H90mP14_0810 [Euryarchaeota archaeon]